MKSLLIRHLKTRYQQYLTQHHKTVATTTKLPVKFLPTTTTTTKLPSMKSLFPNNHHNNETSEHEVSIQEDIRSNLTNATPHCVAFRAWWVTTPLAGCVFWRYVLEGGLPAAHPQSWRQLHHYHCSEG